MALEIRPFAVVTGASSGIGFELAKCCALDGYDLLIVADEPEIQQAAETLRETGVDVHCLVADLATAEGVLALNRLRDGRPVDALLANAGRGLGHAFLDQDFENILRVINTNVTGTLHLIHQIGREMRAMRSGSILITGSIAGLVPGTFEAVYNGTKALLDSFSYALREELRGSGVNVTCLMPGATETDFYERAGMLDTKLGAGKKQSALEVAEAGFHGMQEGMPEVVTGFVNKARAALSHVVPATTLAEQHRKLAQPGSADRR